MMDLRLPNLFKPLRVKGVQLKNRLVMAPMGTRFASYNCKVNDRLRAYYSEVARGGVGLIIVQFTLVSPEGRHTLYTPALWADEFIPGFADLTADLHREGTKVAVQLAHAGSNARSVFTGTRPVAPSAIAVKGGEMPKTLSIAEIEGLVESFAQAARRARDAGFDLVEIHAAHGYLINQFLSPLWNHREDRYGGSTENRACFLLEIVARTREILGAEYPIMVRLCGDEFVSGGITISESCRIARLLEKAGVDILDVSGGIGETSAQTIPPALIPAGSLVSLAADVRQAVKIPVVAVGRLHRPELAEAVLAEGKADLVSLGRALLADPYWPTKAAEGRWDEIRPCLACAGADCSGRTMRQLDLACMVNPTVGRETLFPGTRVQRPKRVMVVGGGPAGMEASMAAAQRGHDVTLYERKAELGGQLHLAATPPHKDEMSRYLEYLRRAVVRSGIRVVLGTEVSAALVQGERPDVVVLATGSRPVVPSVPIQGQQVATAWDVLAGRVALGQNVVVVGGGDVGCETAAFLAAKGKKVTILEMLPDVASELVWWSRDLLVQELASADVEILTNSKLISIDGDTVTYVRSGITNQIRGVDTVIFAAGVTPEDALAKELADSGFDIRVVGDCAKPGNVGAAVRHGFEVGIALE